MSPVVQVTWSLLLSLGVTVVILLRELWIARRNRGDDDRDPRPAPSPGPRPLPPCLVPTEQWRAPSRSRELA